MIVGELVLYCLQSFSPGIKGQGFNLNATFCWTTIVSDLRAVKFLARGVNYETRLDIIPSNKYARSGLPTVSRKNNFTESHIINPLLTKLLDQEGWILASSFFCEFMDLGLVSVYNHAKKKKKKEELGKFPAILTKQTWSITCIK